MDNQDDTKCTFADKCVYHQIVEREIDMLKKNFLPRWVFLASFSGLITLSIVFAGWHINSINAFDERYSVAVKAFHGVADANKSLLIEVKTKQDMVLHKLDLLNGISENE